MYRAPGRWTLVDSVRMRLVVRKKSKTNGVTADLDPDPSGLIAAVSSELRVAEERAGHFEL